MAETPDSDDFDSARDIDFGAFADGGTPWKGGKNQGHGQTTKLLGSATYTGSAAGLHTEVVNGEDDIDYFYGDAELTAHFGDSMYAGRIDGKIENLVVDGVPLPQDDQHTIHLVNPDDPININLNSGRFSGTAVMGGRPDVANPGDISYQYLYAGTWSGRLHNPVNDDPDTPADESLMPPESVVGTFGVRRLDDPMTTDMDETESYVAGFGAHKM